MSSFFWGNKRLDELKAAFDGARFPRKQSLLFDQCKEIVEDSAFKATSGPQKDLCIFHFNIGKCSFAIGASSRAATQTESCIVITGRMQVGHQEVDIKINCTQKFPEEAPQVYVSKTGSDSFHMFPFATLPSPGSSQHWNFCAGTTLIQLLRAMGQYLGPLPYSSHAAMPAPVVPSPVISTPPPGFIYTSPEISRSHIGQTFDDKSPMKAWMENPNAQRVPPPPPPIISGREPASGWPVYPINSNQPPFVPPPPAYPTHFPAAAPQQQFISDTVPTPPITKTQLPVPPSGAPGPPPPRPYEGVSTQDRPIYRMGFNFDDVQRALQEADQDESRAVSILVARQQHYVAPPVHPPAFPTPVQYTSSYPMTPPPYNQGYTLPPPSVPYPQQPPPPPFCDVVPPPSVPYPPPPFTSGHPSAAPPPAFTATREFTVVLKVDDGEFPMCVKAANSVELLDGIKSQIGDIAYPEVCVEGGRWVPMSAIRFEDLQGYMQLRTPVVVPDAPPPQKHFPPPQQQFAPPAGNPPQQQRQSSPSPSDDIAAHGSYPIVRSAEIQFDLDSHGNRIELGRGVFKAVYRGKYFGTPVAVRFCIVSCSLIFSI